MCIQGLEVVKLGDLAVELIEIGNSGWQGRVRYLDVSVEKAVHDGLAVVGVRDRSPNPKIEQ